MYYEQIACTIWDGTEERKLVELDRYRQSENEALVGIH